METTHNERLIAANIAYDLVTAVEQSCRMINRIWERFFSAKKQEPINAYNAAEIGDILNAVDNMLFLAWREFELDTGGNCVDAELQVCYDTADAHRTYRRISALSDAALEAEREIKDTEARRAFDAQRQAACSLPDAQAIEALEILLRKGEGA